MADLAVASVGRGENVDLTGRIRAWYEEHPVSVADREPLLPALLAELPARARVVDLGCGGGFVAAALAESGREVVGVDLAMTGLLHAESRRRLTGCASLSFVRGNLLRPPVVPGSADVVLLLDSADASGSPEGAVASAAAVLAPGGHLILRFARTLNSEAPGATAHGVEDALLWLEAAGLVATGADPALSPLAPERPLLGPHPMGPWVLRQLHALRAGSQPGPQTLVARKRA